MLFEGNGDSQSKNQASLTYNSATIGELVTQDTDGDGIPDWEERLWGTDPTKADTVPGVPDSVTIQKLKDAQEASNPTADTGGSSSSLTQTDQFSRNLFDTIAAATQDGEQSLDPTTLDQISNSLINNIQNTPQQKVYLLSDIKISSDSGTKSVVNYSSTLNDIYKKYPVSGEDVNTILQEFAPDDGTVNPAALDKLTPIITQTKARIAAMLKMSVPVSLVPLHLALLNAGEKLIEDLQNMQLFNTDVVVSLGAASQYENDSANFAAAVTNLNNAIK